MKKHGFIATLLVALSLAVMALPVAAMAESAEVDESVEFYASNICPKTENGKHVYVRVSAQDPTCTEAGHTRGLSCSACGEVFCRKHHHPRPGPRLLPGRQRGSRHLHHRRLHRRLEVHPL